MSLCGFDSCFPLGKYSLGGDGDGRAGHLAHSPQLALSLWDIEGSSPSGIPQLETEQVAQSITHYKEEKRKGK